MATKNKKDIWFKLIIWLIQIPHSQVKGGQRSGFGQQKGDVGLAKRVSVGLGLISKIY